MDIIKDSFFIKLNAIVVIPVYKVELTKEEIISLIQLQNIITQHQLCIVCPNSLDISNYIALFHKPLEIHIERFDDNYFSDISSYNRLMLTVDFYSRFLNYKYILIHQLDCYLFKDELDYWCKKGYDYIGAPWFFYQYNDMNSLRRFIFEIRRGLRVIFKRDIIKEDLYNKVGNGGLSLRSTKAFIRMLQNTPTTIIEKYCSNNTTSVYNEDVFWSIHAKYIRKPKYIEASRFALDLGANYGLKLNNSVLPFGCHAWYKKADQWKGFIKELDTV